MEPFIELLRTHPSKEAWMRLAGELGHELSKSSVAQLEEVQSALAKLQPHGEVDRDNAELLRSLVSAYLQAKHHDATLDREVVDGDVQTAPPLEVSVLEATLSPGQRTVLVAASDSVFLASELMSRTGLAKKLMSTACKGLREYALIEPRGRGADARTRPLQLTPLGVDVRQRIIARASAVSSPRGASTGGKSSLTVTDIEFGRDE